jgi:hypothetical protein
MVALEAVIVVSVPPIIKRPASEMSSPWVKPLPVMGSTASRSAENRSLPLRELSCAIRHSVMELLSAASCCTPYIRGQKRILCMERMNSCGMWPV